MARIVATMYMKGIGMANVEKLSIALTPDMAAAVRQAVESGDYASSSEVIRDALREWKLRRAVDRELVEELRRLWREGIDSGPSEPLDMGEIKREARARFEQAARDG
jgi:antitoxin ParD1/3/4